MKKLYDAAHVLKRRRLLWVEMIEQLRYGSPVSPVLPGQCQDMLDWIIAREWPFDSEPPKPRHDTHLLSSEVASAETLFNLLPEWAETPREPKSNKGHPIFLRTINGLMYVDGRRRINKWYRDNPDQIIKYWVIE